MKTILKLAPVFGLVGLLAACGTTTEQRAASGALGSDPSTPVRGRPGSAAHASSAAAAAGSFVMMPGSPMMAVSPGQMMFAQVC